MSKKGNPATLQFYFKPLPVPENTLLENFAQDKVCVQIPVNLIPYLTPIMRIWQSAGCLKGTTEERDIFIKAWTDLIGQINSAQACEPMIILRQNPLNECQLQQSHDDGQTWTLAFDYSLCLQPGTAMLVEQSTSETFTNWLSAGQNTDINPDAPNDTFVETIGESQERVDNRLLALCAVCKLYIELYCATIKEINEDVTVAANVVALAGAAIVAIGTAAGAFTFGASTLAAFALAGAIGSAGLAGYSALTEAVLDDEIAKQELACCMYFALRTKEATPEEFSHAVDSCVDLSANAELIRATLAVDISNTAGLVNQFNAFINLLAEGVRPAELGLLDDCGCVDGALEPVISFTANTCIPISATGHGTIEHDTGEYWLITAVASEFGYQFAIREAGNRTFIYHFDSIVSGGNTVGVWIDNRNGGQACHSFTGWIDENQSILALSARFDVPTVVRLRIHSTPD